MLFQTAVAPLVLLDFGFGTATVKYVSEALAQGDHRRATQIVHTTLLSVLLLSVAGASGLVVSSRWLATSLFAIPVGEVEVAVIGFRIIAATWLLGMVSSVFGAVVVARQRYDLSSKLASWSVALSTGVGVALALARRDVVLVLLGQGAVAAAMGIFQFRIAARLLPGIATIPRWDAPTFHRSLHFGIGQAAAVLGTLLSGWSDRYILGAFFVPTVVGFYAVVHLLYSQMYGAFGEMGEVLFPAVSRMEGSGRLPEARRLALLVGWTLTSVFGVCATVMAVVGGDFVYLWISADAAHAATATLRLLCIGGILGMVAVAPFYYVLGVGETRWNAICAPVIGLTVLLTSLVLVPRLGLRGVGYGIIAGVTARWFFVVAIWRIHFAREFPFGSFAAHLWVPPLTSLVLLLALTCGHDSVNHAPSWLWLFVETVGTLGVATAAQWAAGEVLPNGKQRRRDVVESFRPLLEYMRLGRREA